MLLLFYVTFVLSLVAAVAGVRRRGVVLNPGRQLLEASQTAIVVGTTQAAVDAVLQQHYSEPASPAAVHADAANQVHWYFGCSKSLHAWPGNHIWSDWLHRAYLSNLIALCAACQATLRAAP